MFRPGDFARANTGLELRRWHEKIPCRARHRDLRFQKNIRKEQRIQGSIPAAVLLQLAQLAGVAVERCGYRESYDGQRLCGNWGLGEGAGDGGRLCELARD